MLPPHDTPPPAARRVAPPTVRVPAASPVPRFTPPPERPVLDPPKRGFDATMAELVPTADLPWLEPSTETFQLVRVVDGFPIARHVFTHGLIRLGRGEDCDLRLEDPLVSRYHALIERQRPDEYALHDQQSSNGVKVNGKRIDRACVLHDGDVLLLGTTRLVFQCGYERRELAPEVKSDRPEPKTAKLLLPDEQPAPPTPTPPDAPARAPATVEPPVVAARHADEAPPATPASARSRRPLAGGGAQDPERETDRAPASAPPPAPAERPEGHHRDNRDSREKPVSPVVSVVSVVNPPDEVPAEAFGNTLTLSPQRQKEEHRETGVGVRAYLRPTDHARWSASHLGAHGPNILITRDAFTIGAGQDVDLPVEGTLMPRVISVIARGVCGFSIHAVTGWPWTTRVNGRVVADSEVLEDEDVLDLGGSRFTFHRGLPD